MNPGASRSRTVLMECPCVSSPLRRGPLELKLLLVGVRRCPLRSG